MYLLGPNYQKLKNNLRLATFKLKLLQRKKTELSQKTRKEIADLIIAKKFQKAKFKVEHIIREDYYVDALEIIEMYCDLLLSRFTLISNAKELDDGIAEAVSSLIWAAPQFSPEIKELKVIADLLSSKYGSQFTKRCKEDCVDTISEILKEKLYVVSTPSRLLVENYLIEISKKFNVFYVPDSYIFAETQSYNDKFDGKSGSRSESSPHSRRKIDFSLVKEPQTPPVTPLSSPSFNVSQNKRTAQLSTSISRTTSVTGKDNNEEQPVDYKKDNKKITIIKLPKLKRQDSVGSLKHKVNIKPAGVNKEGSVDSLQDKLNIKPVTLKQEDSDDNLKEKLNIKPAVFKQESSVFFSMSFSEDPYDKGFNMLFEPDQYINNLSNTPESKKLNLPNISENQQYHFVDNEKLPQIHAESKEAIPNFISEPDKQCHLPILSPVNVKKRVILDTPVSSKYGLPEVKSTLKGKKDDIQQKLIDNLPDLTDLRLPSNNEYLPSAFRGKLENPRDLTNKLIDEIFDSTNIPFHSDSEIDNVPKVPNDDDVKEPSTLQSKKRISDLLTAYKEKEASLKLPTVPIAKNQTSVEATLSPNASLTDKEDYDVLPRLPSVPHAEVTKEKDNLEELYKRFNKLKKK